MHVFEFENWFFSVRGNHEQMMIDTIEGTGNQDLWVINGGSWAYSEDLTLLLSIVCKQKRKCPCGWSSTIVTGLWV